MQHPIHSFPGRHLRSNGKSYLYFGGTAYLGLQDDPEFQEILIRAIRHYGTAYGASRLSNVRFPVFEEAETLLADQVGCQASLVLSSGFLSGQLLCSHLLSEGHPLFALPGTHSALGSSSPNKCSSLPHLESALQDKNAKAPVLLCDTIDFHGRHFPHFDCLKALPLEQVILVADDSHGLGIVGENGSGAFQTLAALRPKELILCASLGKGLATQAGAIFGSARRIATLKQTPLYAGASPPSPASMATLIEAKVLCAERRTRLHANRRLFIDALPSSSLFDYNETHPAFSFEDSRLAEQLEEAGMLVTHFNYPRPESPPTCRIVLSAHHQEEDLARLSAVVNAFLSDHSTGSK